MINVTELRNGVVFKSDNQIWQVLSYEHIKMGRGSGNVKVKVRNLKTGSTVDKSFITGARVEDVEVDKKNLQYLYSDSDNCYFMDPQTFEQFAVGRAILLDQEQFLKEGLTAQVLLYKDQPMSVVLPNSMEYVVAETGPGERGNSVSNLYKKAKLDNGLTVSVPLFIKIGDLVKVDTRNGSYMERVGK